jgi:hypothetical protein
MTSGKVLPKLTVEHAEHIRQVYVSNLVVVSVRDDS